MWPTVRGFRKYWMLLCFYNNMENRVENMALSYEGVSVGFRNVATRRTNIRADNKSLSY